MSAISMSPMWHIQLQSKSPLQQEPVEISCAEALVDAGEAHLFESRLVVPALHSEHDM